MRYVIQAVDTGGKGRDTDEQPEEQAQCVDLYCNSYRVAAGDAAAAEPVGDYLSVYHYRLYKRDKAGKARSRRDHRHYLSHAASGAEGRDKECAKEQQHYRADREVVVIKDHPCSLLISLVSRVLYCSSSRMTIARLIAVTHAPITMLVSVSACGIGSTK